MPIPTTPRSASAGLARTAPKTSRALWLGLAALLASGAASQPLPEGVVFDDFEYASTAWEETLHGDPDTLSLGPPGSLYGANEWVVSASGATETHRMWYRYGWQESNYVPPERSLTATPVGLAFEVTPGRHQAEGCPDADDPSRSLSVQQIASGFTARRGTWAARVRLGALPPQEDAILIHAFWLIAPSSAWVRVGDEEVRVTNEADHEWNNSFLGDRQPFLFSAVGAARGLPEGGYKAPMSSTLTPPVPPGPMFSRTNPDAWTCRYRRGTVDRTLAPEACGALLQGRSVAGLAAPEGEVYATLLIHVADEGLRFELVSDGWGARLEMASGLLTPPMQPAVTTLFSQHLFPGAPDRTCEDRTDLRQRPRFDVDWFLYSTDPGLSRDRALGLVRAIRQRRVARLTTVPGARLERPLRPLDGHADRWGFGKWTAPLALAIEAPRAMAEGETATLVALPAERHGSYRFTWTLSTRYDNDRYTTAPPRSDAYALPFTFPPGARTVLVHIRLEELDAEREVIRNATVQPVERVFMIRRR